VHAQNATPPTWPHSRGSLLLACEAMSKPPRSAVLSRLTPAVAQCCAQVLSKQCTGAAWRVRPGSNRLQDEGRCQTVPQLDGEPAQLPGCVKFLQ
jgi:hypothetical protein